MTTDPLWWKAAAFAGRAHLHQTRWDGATPFATHPFRVALTVRHLFNCDDDICIASALLHDTIEDTHVDYDEVAGEFGEEVASCVAALTKNMALPETEREAAYDRQLASADWRARLIKLADVYDNLRDTKTANQRRRAIDKCRRAIALADADDNPASKTAIAIVAEEVDRDTTA